MAQERSKQVKLYLTSWQKRMVADFAGKASLGNIAMRDLSKMMITWRPGGCLSSYKAPPEGIRVGDWLLYLTDEQMKMVSDELGMRQKITTINVSNRAIEAGEIAFG